MPHRSEKTRGQPYHPVVTKEQYKRKVAVFSTALVVVLAVVYLNDPNVIGEPDDIVSQVINLQDIQTVSIPGSTKEKVEPIYLDTPEPLRALYMTQCVAGTKSFRESLATIADQTEINALVIDVKDYTGRIGFLTDKPTLAHAVSNECGASDMPVFLRSLNDRGIYTIARITVFQDPYLTQFNPDLAVKRASATSTIWTDHKGLSYIDPGAREAWKYIVDLSREAHAVGFDELNFDYIRFPSDGDMFDIEFPWSGQRVKNDPSLGKATVLREFFSYLSASLDDLDIVISADLFGMTMTNPDDLNIGQILEYADPYFDFIAPMVYPSHYPPGFNNFANPNHYPYEIVKHSMDRGGERLTNASSSPLKLRPWLQDFDYGGVYDIEEVRAQIQAVYDAGLTSWMLWSPSNRYTTGALADPSGEYYSTTITTPARGGL
jgi:hypothetical protein